MNILFNQRILILLVFTLFLNSCKKSDHTSISSNNEVKDFVWSAMNSWYNWQENVANLADSKNNSTSSYDDFLSGYDSPEELFNDLLDTNNDRFSWFIDDYVAQQQQFQGISTAFGITMSPFITPDGNNIIVYIQHVVENSPAYIGGLKRGDIINGINGTVMTVDNYINVFTQIYSNNTITFNIAQNDGVTSKQSITITKAEINDNPVYLTKTFENVGGKKVGYLVYNSFRSSYNDELNTAFAQLASEGIDELILDFRINGGGALETCAYLASMIYSPGTSDDIFASLIFNSKHQDYTGSYFFESEMNTYDSNGNETGTQVINKINGLTKIYVLTSNRTASASEMIINGLRPYIDVLTVGDVTTGKNVGSITLYDNPGEDYLYSETLNSSHSYAMQPIVFQIYNSDLQSDYLNGFIPDITVEEWQYWDNILPFGDENEIVLQTALNDIRGISAKTSLTKKNSLKFQNNFSNNKFDKEMYITKKFFK